MKQSVFFFFLFLASFFITSCESFEPSSSEYSYEVSGSSGSYSVTLQNTDDNTQQWASVNSGWYYSWKQSGTRWLYISAQNNLSSGNVTVKIIKDGQVVASNTSYGGYSIATVSGEY